MDVETQHGNLALAQTSTRSIIRRSAPRYFLVCGLAQVKCLSQGSPLKHDGRRKTTKRKKNKQKGFKGSSTGPPGEEIPRVSLRDLRGEKLDDGWPESVEEQGLLLLVWRHNCTNNI